MALEFQEIEAARRRIAPLVEATPLKQSLDLSDRLNAPVWLKYETLHATGAFKIRGATNRVLAMAPEERARGVVTVSTGNHGRALAYLARQMALRAVVCITDLVPKEKLEALEALGAEVQIAGKDQNEADKRARALAEREGLVFVPPFDDRHVIAGQGTIGLEMLEARPELETLVVQLSGGGLISGIALAAKSLKPSIRIIAVSTMQGAAMMESVQAGRIVEVEERPSIADALPGPIPQDNRYTFPLCQRLVDDYVQVEEQEIAEAMAFILKSEKCLVEGAAAVGVAALLSGRIELDGEPAATVLTGNNIDAARALKICKESQHV